jgi:hexosaminidase
MKKKTILLCILLFVVNLCAYSQEGGSVKNEPRVLPTPQELTAKAFSFKITSQVRIILGEGTSNDDAFAADQINEQLEELNARRLKVAHEQSVRKISSAFIFLGSPRSSFAGRWLEQRKTALGPELKSEGYILDVDRDGVVIIAESPAGRFYGVMTLLQLLERNKRSVTVPGLFIRDWPFQKMRGITDDLSRGQVSTTDNFKKIIRFLARYKLNVYSPYIEDIFHFKSYPQIGRGRGDLTAAEMRDLDAYAKRYHVQLIPIFETLGHWENILILPEFARYAEFPGAHTLNVSDDAIYKMLDEMIGELSAAFSSPYFNIGADESWDVGLGASKQRVAASDLATVHAEHYRKLFAILKKYKKKPMMYGDILLNNPTILEKIPKDVTIVDWHYSASEHYPSPEILRNAGFPYVVSPAVWSFTGPFPNYINTFVNVENLDRDGFANSSLGILTSNWNDYGGEALRELNYYGYAWTAECAWAPLRATTSSFNTTFFEKFFGNRHAGLLGQAIYTLLSDPVNQINWNELWRHPMLPLPPSPLPYLWRVQSLGSTMALANNLLADLTVSASRNRDHLDDLKFILHLNSWFADKVSVGERLKRLSQDTTRIRSKDSVVVAAIRSARDLVADLKKLKEEFKTLWLKTNRNANLQWLMLRYDRQAAYWEETISQLERGEPVGDPTIESKWIYHPVAHPRLRDSTAEQVPHAYFRKSFTMEEVPTTAKLQLIGDTQAKVWVNNVEVGEVVARQSLSLIVEHQRVKMWEVGSLLGRGRNTIAVEAANYNQFGSAGVNVYMELSTGERVTKILSDSTWKVSDRSADHWQSPDFNDRGWMAAEAKPYPNPVIRPDFVTGRLSWIER